MKVRISADSTCDLSRELVEKYDLGIARLYVTLNGNSYRDGVEIESQDVFANVESGGRPGTTSAVNVEDYRQFFAKRLEACDGIVHFTISSDMSSCYQNACIAAKEFENVFVVDSRSLSTGIGHLVLDAAILAREGIAAQEIAEEMEKKRERLDVSFILDTLEYLKMGGRCSSLAALGANLLGLKPCIEVRNGQMHVGKKYRGHLDRCLVKYVSERLKNPSEIDDARVFITDSGVPEAVFEQVRTEVLRCMPFREVIHTRAGCTVSNHCGPNCLGILFYRK